MRITVVVVLTVVKCLFFHTATFAENWPGWRGPRHDGTSNETKVPLHWTAAENVHWRIKIPGYGHSSPIVWENRIFITTCDPASLARLLLCVDRQTGEVLWAETVATCPIETMHRDNTPASATPVTDGSRVFVAFQVEDKLQISSFDFHGEHQWTAFPGSFESRHGFCTSLVLDGERLIISGLQDSPNAFVAAIDKSTGKSLWKVPRRDKVRSFSSPLPCVISGNSALLLSGANQTVAYESDTGRVLWQTEGPAEKTVSSIVACQQSNLAFVCGGRDNGFLAVSLDASDKNKAAAQSQAPYIAWEASKGIPYMTSPLVAKGFLHVISDEGVYRCYEASSGKIIKQLRPVGAVRASMVATDEYIYVTEKSGKTTVVKNDETWSVVAENDIGEEVMASAAISDGDFILRTKEHLVLIR